MFGEAAERSGAARREYLDRACADDPDLRRNVETLLAHDNGGATGCPAPGDDLAGLTRIGRYDLIERIAAGGMGVVYLAEQEHPRRKVALKLIRPGLVSKPLLERFRVEAELLGRLKHPGIAQIHEAGEAETAAGRLPYFAMEYIEGEEIRSFAEARSLGVAARLELLARICDAVHHAHQMGIVHRDLKPANVLVVEGTSGDLGPSGSGPDPIGQPKVLDFGVSRLIEGQSADVERLTQTGLVVGTVAYMSPEQARGDKGVDTRSDVYALGVIGFELLTGRLPHDCDGMPLAQAISLVQETPAPRLDSVRRELRGDPTVIIGKALALEREQRYDSAAALAADFRRYLSHQPIAARPPTFTYQLGRFVRRHKAVVFGCVVAVLSLLAGLVFATLAGQEQARLRALAEARTKDARRAAYAAQLQAGAMYLETRDTHSALRSLQATPANLRGWEWDYLSAACEDEIARYPMAILRRPRPGVSPDQAAALVVTEGGTLRLIDLTDFSFADHPGVGSPPTAAVLLADQRTALVGDAEGALHLVDLASDAAPRLLFRAEGTVFSLGLSPDGRHAVAIDSQLDSTRTSRLLVIESETLAITTRIALGSLAHDAAFSPDGTQLAAGMIGGSVLVFDTATGRRRHELPVQAPWTYGVRFSPDGRTLASTGADCTIRLWSLETGREEKRFGPFQHIAFALAFRRDGSALVSGHEDGSIRRWNLETGACDWITRGPIDADPGTGGILALGFPEPGGLVVGIGATGIRVRTSPDLVPAVLAHRQGEYPYVSGVRFSPDGLHLLSTGWDGAVRIWDVATRRQVSALACPDNTLWIRQSPASGKLLVCSQLGYTYPRLSLWNAVTHVREQTLDVRDNRPCGIFVPGGDAILLGVRSELWVVDPDTLSVREKRPYPADIWALSASSDGKLIALGTDKGQCTVLDAGTLDPLLVIDASEQAIETLAFSPDGTRLAIGTRDAFVRVFDLSTGKKVLSIDVPECRDILTILYTGDGRRILVGSRHPAIRVFDARTGEELVRLLGHRSYVNDLAFSPDGRILASASGDNTVRLWDTRPLTEQVQARDRLLGLERDTKALVDRLFAQHDSRAAVLTAIESLPTLDPERRHAARDLALSRER